jgi:hypothetical protein
MLILFFDDIRLVAVPDKDKEKEMKVDVDVDDVVDDLLKQVFSLSEDEDGSNVDDYGENDNKKDESFSTTPNTTIGLQESPQIIKQSTETNNDEEKEDEIDVDVDVDNKNATVVKVSKTKNLLLSTTRSNSSSISTNNRLVFLKLPKTGSSSLKSEIQFFEASMETCFANITQYLKNRNNRNDIISNKRDNKINIKTVTMVRSPRSHAISMYMHCQFSAEQKTNFKIKEQNRNIFPLKGEDMKKEDVIRGFDNWLDYMLNMDDTKFINTIDSFDCYTPWNLQSRMMTCNIKSKHHHGAQIIRKGYYNEQFQKDNNIHIPKIEPDWDDVKDIILSNKMAFIGLTEHYKESVCIIHYIHSKTMPSHCDCTTQQQQQTKLQNRTHGVPHLLDVSDLSLSTLRKIDEITKVDVMTYQLSQKIFNETLQLVESESGIKLIC